jgi:DNA-binding response OmpR family regulator
VRPGLAPAAVLRQQPRKAVELFIEISITSGQLTNHTRRAADRLALCDRYGEEIARANDLDLAGDVDRHRHLVMVAGSRRSLTATHCQIFMLLYRHRGDVVYNDRIHAELSEGRDRPSADMRQLRKVLAGSRYQIVNYRSIGYD